MWLFEPDGWLGVESFGAFLVDVIVVVPLCDLVGSMRVEIPAPSPTTIG